ncbi:hypothetical protein KP509_28G037000 [Ceratopteris richardii]|nr:hypothetical protein KP509_28G037000 [Ceratopteris richardii]
MRHKRLVIMVLRVVIMVLWVMTMVLRETKVMATGFSTKALSYVVTTILRKLISVTIVKHGIKSPVFPIMDSVVITPITTPASVSLLDRVREIEDSNSNKRYST